MFMNNILDVSQARLHCANEGVPLSHQADDTNTLAKAVCVAREGCVHTPGP